MLSSARIRNGSIDRDAESRVTCSLIAVSADSIGMDPPKVSKAGRLPAPPAETLSESVDWGLTDLFFNQKIILIFGGFAPVSVAAFGFFRTGQVWFLWWALAALVVLAGRLGVDAAYARRTVRSGRPTAWRYRFLIGTWANGALCGLAAAGSILATDAFTQMLVVMMVTAYVMGSATRNGAYPKAAIGSVLLAGVPLMIASVARSEIHYVVFMLFAAVLTFSAISVVRHMYAQTVRFLVTDEEMAALVSEVSRSNAQLAVANENLAAVNEKLGSANAQLARVAGTDGLTGVPNRRSFDEALAVAARATRRDASQLSLLLIDIDLFKGYNDRYGHPAGDECLRIVARTLAAGVLRPRDFFARYGGEEFVALLPQTGDAGLFAIAETLREAVCALGIPYDGSPLGVVTVSIGLATARGDEQFSSDKLLQRADRALYVAKNAGRNRVHAAAIESTAFDISA